MKALRKKKELMDKLGSSLVLTDFPKEQKPFYMKQSGMVTKSFDILARGVGEIVGGSLREEDSEILRERMSPELRKTLSWYLELREVDKLATGGYGLGFERILMYYLELESIKEAIAFPRWKDRLDM